MTIQNIEAAALAIPKDKKTGKSPGGYTHFNRRQNI
jgi:hypothetical protein